MSSQSLYILWDESQIWGLLAWRGMLGLGPDFRPVRSQEITQGLLADKPPAVLLVPGGVARLKAAALGQAGLEAVRAYVRGGGHYLGFCGGAGLGLSTPDGRGDDSSLGLCPWTRGAYEDRMQHFMSGHLEAGLENRRHRLSPCSADPAADACLHDTPPLDGAPLLPVWWPGRFMPEDDPSVTVLARYGLPGDDFWLADLPIKSLPEDAFSTWRDLYGINISPAFLAGQPCVIHGDYGKGSYTLSYSHLETPDSGFANHWLAHILRSLGVTGLERDSIPAWRLGEQVNWDDPGIVSCLEHVRLVITTGVDHSLLFKRNDWLHGWRTGIPGSAMNNLFAAVASAAALAPTPAALALWEREKNGVLERMELFSQAAIHYLLAERLAMTLARTLPDAVSPDILRAQRHNLFGPPMQARGLYRDLIKFFDELVYLQICRPA